MNEAESVDWSELRARVFSDRPRLENPFQEEDWDRLLLPSSLALSPAEAAAFSLASGDSHAVVFARKHAFEGYEACRVALTAAAFGSLVLETPFGSAMAEVCSENGSWGFVADPENVCLVGGRPGIIEGITQTLGGLSAVQAAFFRAVEAGEIGFGEPAVRYLESLAESVGWSRGHAPS